MSDKNNKLITEKLFGECWHNIKFNDGLIPQLGENFCLKCDKSDIENHNFYKSYSDNQEMLNKIREKDLHFDFSHVLNRILGGVVLKSYQQNKFNSYMTFYIASATLEQKADAVVEVLKNE